MSHLVDRQKKIIQSFSAIENWEGRYKKIIELGQQMPTFLPEWQSEDLLVKGCQSRVWLKAEMIESGRIIYRADSDALIVKGLVALLVQLYSDATPDEILSTSPDFVSALDLGSHLSPSRANGLYSMIKQIKFYAAAFKAKGA